MLEPKLIHVRRFPNKERYKVVNYLVGLDLEITPQLNRFYRSDGAVDSIPSHLISVLEEFGFEVQNGNELLKAWADTTGHCRYIGMFSGDGDAKFSIPFYRRTYSELDAFNLGHEDTHAIQHLELSEAYPILNDKFRNHGYKLDIQAIQDKESQANIIGLLTVLEKRLDLKKLLHFPEIRSAWEYMGNHRL